MVGPGSPGEDGGGCGVESAGLEESDVALVVGAEDGEDLVDAGLCAFGYEGFDEAASDAAVAAGGVDSDCDDACAGGQAIAGGLPLGEDEADEFAAELGDVTAPGREDHRFQVCHAQEAFDVAVPGGRAVRAQDLAVEFVECVCVVLAQLADHYLGRQVMPLCCCGVRAREAVRERPVPGE